MYAMTSMTDLPERLQSAVNNELRSGERLHWMQQPIPRYFTPNSIGAFIFGIPWTSFAVFWTFGAMGFQLPDFSDGLSFFHLFPLFGLPFIAVGIGMLLAPVLNRLNMKNTVYLLTDRRAVMIEGMRTVKVRDVALADIVDTERSERQDGRGDIRFLFDSREQPGDGGRKTVRGRRKGRPGFHDIPRVRETEHLLDDFRAEAKAREDT